jgi:hypothetical protein
MPRTRFRRVVRRAALAAAAAVLLWVAYLVSCPLVLHWTTHRINDPLRESFLVRVYQPAIDYAEGDLPGSSVYLVYFNLCRRELPRWHEHLKKML